MCHMEILITSNNFHSTEWIHQSNAGKALLKNPRHMVSTLNLLATTVPAVVV